MTRGLDRRRTLQLGAGAAALAFAGCLGGDGDNGGPFEGDIPEYTQYLDSEGSSNEDLPGGPGVMLLAYVGASAVEETEERDIPTIGSNSGSGLDDDLLGAFLAISLLSFSGWIILGTGLESLVLTADSNGQQDDLETDIQAQIRANDGFVLQGEINTEEVDDLLENPPTASQLPHPTSLSLMTSLVEGGACPCPRPRTRPGGR